jgi:3-methyl-2-oxobutanoate hydroxymethyltransferase
VISDAVANYAADVRAASFPGEAEVYRFKTKV